MARLLTFCMSSKVEIDQDLQQFCLDHKRRRYFDKFSIFQVGNSDLALIAYRPTSYCINLFDFDNLLYNK